MGPEGITRYRRANCVLTNWAVLAGKTTLVNWILAQKAGRRVAVIENEFGEVNIDRALGTGFDGVRGFAGTRVWPLEPVPFSYNFKLLQIGLWRLSYCRLHAVSENLIAKEDVVSLENGCVCCSLRSDIIDALKQLEDRTRRLGCRPIDAVLLETTGLADPGPVVSPLHWRINGLPSACKVLVPSVCSGAGVYFLRQPLDKCTLSLGLRPVRPPFVNHTYTPSCPSVALAFHPGFGACAGLRPGSAAQVSG